MPMGNGAGTSVHAIDRVGTLPSPGWARVGECGDCCARGTGQGWGEAGMGGESRLGGKCRWRIARRGGPSVQTGTASGECRAGPASVWDFERDVTRCHHVTACTYLIWHRWAARGSAVGLPMDMSDDIIKVMAQFVKKNRRVYFREVRDALFRTALPHSDAVFERCDANQQIKY